MNRAKLERYTAGVLFVLVLVVFSFAERDTKKISRLYQNAGNTKIIVKVNNQPAILPFTQLTSRKFQISTSYFRLP